MSKKTNKKQVGAKAKRAKGTAEARAKSAKPKDGMSLGAKVALTVFAVLMALSMIDYCISHNNNYRGTAIKYEVSYSQVYSWVKKYWERGEAGLEDKRGHHKSDDQVDELERLRRENQRLKRQLEERDMLCELLKKVKDLEGM